MPDDRPPPHSTEPEAVATPSRPDGLAIGSVAGWAYDFVASRDLTAKQTQPALPPEALHDLEQPRDPLRIERPGRPPELTVVDATPRSTRPGALQRTRGRASLLHTFWHHELQAAELMAWAILAYPATPPEFRRGLYHIACDEIRHMAMYRARIRALGFDIGAFPVRDWFWERVPQCRTPLEFVALLGLGLEGGNLDHSTRFVEAFEAAGDPAAAAVQRTVCREEIAHVAFARQWFETWTGEAVDFEAWRRTLTPPLTPSMLRGRPVNRRDREAAGLSPEFVDALIAWTPNSASP